jgi:hypothetical protein
MSTICLQRISPSHLIDGMIEQLTTTGWMNIRFMLVLILWCLTMDGLHDIVLWHATCATLFCCILSVKYLDPSATSHVS